MELLAEKKKLFDGRVPFSGNVFKKLARCVLCNISSIRRSVSSPDESLRRELKYDAQRSFFDELRGVSSGNETLCRMLDVTS